MAGDLLANDLRRYAIHQRTEITYRVRAAGQACVVDANGIIKIPGIGGRPPYNVEAVLARADEFELQRGAEKPRIISREQMIQLLQATARKPAASEKEE